MFREARFVTWCWPGPVGSEMRWLLARAGRYKGRWAGREVVGRQKRLIGGWAGIGGAMVGDWVDGCLD